MWGVMSSCQTDYVISARFRQHTVDFKFESQQHLSVPYNNVSTFLKEHDADTEFTFDRQFDAPNDAIVVEVWKAFLQTTYKVCLDAVTLKKLSFLDNRQRPLDRQTYL